MSGAPGGEVERLAQRLRMSVSRYDGFLAIAAKHREQAEAADRKAWAAQRNIQALRAKLTALLPPGA